ncbi:MAG: prepilin-type N-terminal cleavage/methylation domain-containing protein [Steroidobacteraceae bacterium]
MHSITPARDISGFALIEALVALLLLAIAMVGTATALVESLAGQRTALTQTQAADLAGNLAEALRAAPDGATAAAEIQAWRVAALAVLPRAEPTAVARNQVQARSGMLTIPARFDIRLQWQDAPGRTASRLTLPLAFNPAAAPY